jgi:hypothetical protein
MRPTGERHHVINSINNITPPTAHKIDLQNNCIAIVLNLGNSIIVICGS